MPQPSRRRSSTIVSGTIGRKVPWLGQEFLAGDGQEADQPGRAEQQRVVVLARGRPDLIAEVAAMCAACASPSDGACTVGTPISRNNSRASATISLRQARRHRRFRVSGGDVAARQRGRTLLFVALPSGAALRDLPRLERRRRRRRTRTPAARRDRPSDACCGRTGRRGATSCALSNRCSGVPSRSRISARN